MKSYLLKYRKPEVLDGLFNGIGDSLNITFREQELGEIKTFGDLCDLVYSKLPLEKVALCTTQQSFYRLRSEIAGFLGVETATITPESGLEQLFPRAGRRRMIRQFQQESGISILYLKPRKWIVAALLLMLGWSLFALLFSATIGTLGSLIAIVGFWIAATSGKEFDYRTVCDAANAMAQEQYLIWRSDPYTINHKEVEALIRKAFCEQFAFEPAMLTWEAHF